MAKLKKFEKPSLTKEDIFSLGEQYDTLSKQIKELDNRKKDLSSKIKEGAEKFGVKDDKGSFYLENDNYILGKVAKKSMKLNQEKAKEKLESLGLGNLIDKEIVYVVNEEKLEKAIKDNKISLEVVKSFTDTKVDYSVSVKCKKEMPEVEQTSLKAAKRK